VRDLPDDVHRCLSERASASGRSLQQYLTAELTTLAEQPTLEEVVARIERRQGGTVGLEQAVRDLESVRSGT